MAILHSLPTMLLFGAAVILAAWGAVKRGHVLPFFGGLLGAAALVADLVDGGTCCSTYRGLIRWRSNSASKTRWPPPSGP